MEKRFTPLLLIVSLGGCLAMTPLPEMPPPRAITTPEEAIRIAIVECGGRQTTEVRYWHVRRGYELWIAEYHGNETYWSSDDSVHVKAIIDAPTGKLLNCVDLAPVIITAH